MAVVTRDGDFYYFSYIIEEDSDDVIVDEDEACSRTKKVIPSQDQPHYHILMVDSDEDNPQFQLNVPEGNQLCVSRPRRINIK